MSLLDSGVNNLNSVAFLTLGCKVNSYETEVNIEIFKNN